MKTKIGILGSGVVAKSLAAGFLKYGYDVTLGTRAALKLRDFDPRAKVGSFNEAAGWADTIVLACKGTAAEDVIKIAGYDNFKNKTVIDATNPISDEPPQNNLIKFFTKPDRSLMEILQGIIPEADFVKCFNSVGSALMVDPEFPDGKPTMFICGNNEDAKLEVKEILDKFGWETEDLGGAESARAIEPLCILWCIPGFMNNQWSHAFKLIKK